MHPELLQLGPFTLRGYALAVLIGAIVGLAVRRIEVRRLAYDRDPRHRWVGLGALLGAVLGAKLGMVLFEPAAPLHELWARIFALDFAGKTVVGGIAGGYLGVELTKRLVGLRGSTGDAFAVALPLSLAFGRLGCWLEGCCYGVPSAAAWAVELGGVTRAPVQLVDAAGLALLAAWQWSRRTQPRPRGDAFRATLVGIALVRFGTQFLRGDPVLRWGPLDAVQWVCLATVLGFGALLLRSAASRPADPGRSGGAAA